MTRCFIYLNLACVMLFLFVPAAEASVLSYVSDLISTSAPATGASHAIQFTVVQAIPAGGQIVIVPEGAFSLPAGFDVSDVSFLVSTGGPYTSRTLASVPSAIEDGVAIVSGSSPSIIFTLNSNDGIPAGSAVRVVLASTSSAHNPVNASALGSYRIRINTFLGNGTTLDYGAAMIAVVAPVTTMVGLVQHDPQRSNGEPSGTIAAGNSTIELSLTTDELSSCRYATTTGVTYGAMTHTLTPSVSTVFYTDLTGFQDNTSYVFYVRCISTQGIVNTDDYPISFTLSPTPASNTSIASTNSAGSGNNGTGQYPNGSTVLYLGSVELTGFTSPGASITVLQDGTAAGTASADSSGRFDITIANLERGIYTFGVYATDAHGVKTAPDSETLTLNQGSSNLISGILLPPSISVTSNSVAVGDDVTISGATFPGVQVEVSAASNPLRVTASSSSSGSWSVVIPGTSLSKGSYQIVARTIKSADSISDFSTPLQLNVGATAAGACNSSTDMNGDGKVNLIDFSIFLTDWGAGPLGDFNCDGNVNLADFSIMLFNWTG